MRAWPPGDQRNHGRCRRGRRLHTSPLLGLDRVDNAALQPTVPAISRRGAGPPATSRFSAGRAACRLRLARPRRATLGIAPPSFLLTVPGPPQGEAQSFPGEVGKRRATGPNRWATRPWLAPGRQSLIRTGEGPPARPSGCASSERDRRTADHYAGNCPRRAEPYVGDADGPGGCNTVGVRTAGGGSLCTWA